MAATNLIQDHDLPGRGSGDRPNTSDNPPHGQRAQHTEANEDIDDSDLNRIGSGVGPNNLMDIARSYLNVPEHDIETYEASVRGDMKTLKFKILEHWRNQNPGPDARKKLFDLLEQARKVTGSISRECYRFLLEFPKKSNSGKQYTVNQQNLACRKI